MTELPLEIPGWWLAATAAGSILNALAYPIFRRWVAASHPSLRSLFRLWYIASAPVAAAVAVAVVARPAIADFLIPAHCHGSQCGAHSPFYTGDSVALVALAAAGSLAVLAMLAMLAWAVRRGRRQLRLLRRFTRDSVTDYRILESQDLVACCAGLWRPQVILSRGLIDRLRPDELRVVLAHERAHAARLDNLRALLLRCLTLFWPAPLRERACSDGRADAEQACDLYAARTVAGSESVAAVIRILSEWHSPSTAVRERRGAGFHCDDTSARLAALEQGATWESAPFSHWLQAAIILSLNYSAHIVVLTVASHRMIEWLGSVAA